jgi:hypothetical protein
MAREKLLQLRERMVGARAAVPTPRVPCRSVRSVERVRENHCSREGRGKTRATVGTPKAPVSAGSRESSYELIAREREGGKSPSSCYDPEGASQCWGSREFVRTTARGREGGKTRAAVMMLGVERVRTNHSSRESRGSWYEVSAAGC